MNWDALGAMGEIFGALAVVSTLGYLATQVRQNSQGMIVAAKLDIEKNFNEYTNLILEHPELFDLQIRGMLGQDLDAIEKSKFSLLLQKATTSFSSMYYQSQRQNLSEDEWYESQRLIRWFTLAPGYQSWWEQNEINYREDFRIYLTKIFESGEG
jgi:hypothetical protein